MNQPITPVPATATALAHWQSVFEPAGSENRSWHQSTPEMLLEIVRELRLPTDAAMLDVGGGDSLGPDALLAAGFANITVLDIAPAALARSQARLGTAAANIRWWAADIRTVSLPPEAFDLWYDRAVLHFLTDPADSALYAAQARHALRPGGVLAVGVFHPEGPKRCSGLDVCPYDAQGLERLFADGFKPLRNYTHTHHTPSGTEQLFQWAWFERVS